MRKPDQVLQEEFDFVVSSCVASGVDPYLIFAIGWHETQWGTKGWGRYGYILGVGCYNEKKVDEHFKGLVAQVTWAVHNISDFIGFRVTQKGLENFARHVWKPGNPSLWAADVWRCYAELINAYAPEMPICQEPPKWVVEPLLTLYQKHIINTPYGDLDFYRTVQIVYNFMLVFGGKK